MKIKDDKFFSVIRSFLNIYLLKNRGCSLNTVESYEDTLNLYFDFLSSVKAIPRQKADWICFSRQIVQEFIDWLETNRGCSRTTQLQRLAAIRSFLRYGAIVDLRAVSFQAEVEKIRYRKQAPKLIGYLKTDETALLFEQPDPRKRTGFRDMVFMVLMYDTAARCQEMLDLRIQDLVLNKDQSSVYLTGKGNKTRHIPILPKTAEHLRSYLKKYHPKESRKRGDYVFYAYGGPQRPMSPDTVAAFIKKYGLKAKQQQPSFPDHVHPHMLRHTRAMHMYQSGCSLEEISEYLGHAQLETTRIYACADTEMKRKAIQKASKLTNGTIPEAVWNLDDENMMNKLRGK